jgi:hypothetical protein
MPTDPAAVEQPKHPMHALTTYELRDYRRQLERAIKGIAPDAPGASRSQASARRGDSRAGTAQKGSVPYLTRPDS